MGMNPITYDYASFTVNTGTTDYDVKSGVSALFNRVKTARGVIIRVDQDISIKFNATSEDAIDITQNEVPWQPPLGYLDVTNIFITNASGSTATVKIMLV